MHAMAVGSSGLQLGLEALGLSAAPRLQCFLETAPFPRSEFLIFWAHLRLAARVSGTEVGGHPLSVSFAPSWVPV